VLNVRYDPAARSAFVRLRNGRAVRSRRLSHQALAEYGRHGQLLTISIEDVDPTAAEFLRTADEETLLRVIAQQAGARAAGGPGAGQEGRGNGRPRRRTRR
jgi:uncharacterized protein YuzE